MLLTMSHTLLYNMTMTRCLCVEHFARFAFELNMPPIKTTEVIFLKDNEHNKKIKNLKLRNTIILQAEKKLFLIS